MDFSISDIGRVWIFEDVFILILLGSMVHARTLYLGKITLVLIWY